MVVAASQRVSHANLIQPCQSVDDERCWRRCGNLTLWQYHNVGQVTLASEVSSERFDAHSENRQILKGRGLSV